MLKWELNNKTKNKIEMMRCSDSPREYPKFCKETIDAKNLNLSSFLIDKEHSKS